MMRTSELKTEVQSSSASASSRRRAKFYAHGYEGTTLNAIADGLKVTKPFIYSYFRNKSEILRAICEIGIRSSLVALDEAMARKLPPGEAADHRRQCHVDHFEESGNISWCTSVKRRISTQKMQKISSCGANWHSPRHVVAGRCGVR
jgi:AcrR family transcriptional regulator